MFVSADPVQSLKNSSTGLKLTNFQLDLVEESRDQVKIEAQMTHSVATQTGSLEVTIVQNLDLDLEINIESQSNQFR